MAINAAFLRPDLVATVTADSFHGRSFPEDFDEALLAEHSSTIEDPESSQFYHWCIGEDWKDVVKRDIDCMWRFIISRRELFFDSLKILQAPLLMTATKKTKLFVQISKESTRRSSEKSATDNSNCSKSLDTLRLKLVLRRLLRPLINLLLSIVKVSSQPQRTAM